MDRLDAMGAFVAVADLRGFAPAARRLGLSPPTVTRLVASLEERLSIRLLQRTTRSVTLTDGGARYLDHARRILAGVQEAEAGARAEHVEPRGRFSVTAPSLFGRLEVAPLVCAFQARHPAVVCHLDLADRPVNLVEEGVDLAVRIGALQDSSLHARKLGETRRVVVASPGYLARRRRPRAPRDLARHAIIQFTSLAPTAEWRFVRRAREERVTFTPSFVTNSADAALEHAQRGGGLCMLLAYQVAKAVAARRLAVVLSSWEPPPLPIQLVYPSARLLSANVRAFVDMALETRDWRYTTL